MIRRLLIAACDVGARLSSDIALGLCEARERLTLNNEVSDTDRIAHLEDEVARLRDRIRYTQVVIRTDERLEFAPYKEDDFTRWIMTYAEAAKLGIDPVIEDRIRRVVT